MRFLAKPQAAFLVLLVAAGPASAHNLGAEAKLVGDRVRIEAYFSDDTPAGDARVTVQDAAEKTVAEGRTDDKGVWEFPRPAGGKYRVTVDAGAGHRARILVTVPEGPPAQPGAVTVSDGPGREEFTRFPWERVALGLGLIALAAAGWRALRKPVRTA